MYLKSEIYIKTLFLRNFKNGGFLYQKENQGLKQAVHTSRLARLLSRGVVFLILTKFWRGRDYLEGFCTEKRTMVLSKQSTIEDDLGSYPGGGVRFTEQVLARLGFSGGFLYQKENQGLKQAVHT